MLGYQWAFGICGGMAVAATVLVVGLKVKYDWEAEAESRPLSLLR